MINALWVGQKYETGHQIHLGEVRGDCMIGFHKALAIWKHEDLEYTRSPPLADN
jgi:hypothetical protein